MWTLSVILTQSIFIRVVHPFADPEDGDACRILCLLCLLKEFTSLYEARRLSSLMKHAAVIKSQHSPWRTTAFSEGLAAMMLLSCCSMSLRWFSDGSTSLHTDYTSQNIQIHKCVTKSKPVLYKYFHYFKFSGTNISPWCRLVLHLHLLCPYWRNKPVSLTFLQTLK